MTWDQALEAMKDGFFVKRKSQNVCVRAISDIESDTGLRKRFIVFCNEHGEEVNHFDDVYDFLLEDFEANDWTIV